MERVGLIGSIQQIDRSLSPLIHNAAFRAEGLDWVYEGFPMESVEKELPALVAEGVRGANVTMPHKAAAASLCGRMSEDAGKIGAVNTLVFEGGQIIGYNTDGDGFLDALESQGWESAGKSVVVIGGGGAGRAIAYALVVAGASVHVCVRDPSRWSSKHQITSDQLRLQDMSEVGRLTKEANLLVNATPLGQSGEEIPGTSHLHSSMYVVDLVYGVGETPLMKLANAAGANAYDGLGMLIHQAARSFQIWTDIDAPIGVMWDAVSKVL